jgi:hypothetical protein
MNSSSKAATCVVMATRAVPKAPQTLWSTETHCSPSLAGGPRCHPLQCPNSDASTPKAGMVSLGPRKMAGKTGPHQVGNSRKSPQYSTSNPPQNDPTSIGAKKPEPEPCRPHEHALDHLQCAPRPHAHDQHRLDHQPSHSHQLQCRSWW